MKIFFEIIWAFISFLKVPLVICLVSLILFIGLVYYNVIVGLIKGKRFKKGEHNHVRKPSVLKRLLIDYPKRIADDMFDRDPESFRHSGLIIFEGRQGRGKTIAMVQCAREMQEEYPKSICLSNLDYKGQDEELDNWTKLLEVSNDKYGVIALLDETQNWFSSNQSKDFPPEMLSVITQNRKNRRVILGTAQNFYLLAKAIRSQATEVRRCATILGALTIVRRVEPILNSDGNVVKWKHRGIYFFVHDKELRNSYDTYHVIESLSKSGFQPRTETTFANTVIINNKKK